MTKNIELLRILVRPALLFGAAAMVASMATAEPNPFVGSWKFVPDKSRFDRRAPKDIKLKFVIDEGLLREEEETTTSDGRRFVGSYVHQYDGREHPFNLSGETRHRTHTVLWTRIDANTVERRINHDNGKEYTTERLAVSPDGNTLTETHWGKHVDGTAYEVVESFVRQQPRAHRGVSRRRSRRYRTDINSARQPLVSETSPPRQ
jgi:hypothetical protein